MPQKILARFSDQKLDQAFFFILLLGLIPAIANYSLLGFTQNASLVLLREDGSVITSLANGILTYIFPLILLPLGALLCMARQRYWGLLGILPFIYKIATLYELSGNPILPFHISAFWGFVIYQAAFWYFIIKGRSHLRSVLFLIFLGILFFLLGFQKLILFLGYILVARLFYLAVTQNLSIFRNIGLGRTIQLIFKTFLYWSPLLIFIIPAEIVSKKIYNKAVENIYVHTFVDTTTANANFEADVYNSVNLLFDSLEQQILDSIEVQRKSAGDDMDAFLKNIDRAYVNTVPDKIPGMDPQTCDDILMFVPCSTVINPTRRSIQRTVKNKKKQGRTNLNRSLNKKKGEAEANVDELATLASEEAVRQIRFLKQGARTSTMLSFKTIYFINLLLDISLLFIILKSFFYVFARVAFSEKDQLYVTLKEGDDPMQKGKLTPTGNQYTISADSQEQFYISRAFEPSGRPPRFTIPQWRSAALARIGSKTFAMNKVDMNKGEGPVDFRSMGGAEFVEWEIQDGEEVVFKLKNFVAMSESVRLKRKISLRLTSLLVGRIFFTIAEGPGKLILMTDGKPITSGDPKAASSVATNRIVAWQKNTLFNVQSELNLVDVFLSGIHLKKTEDDLLIIDADMKGGSQTGIVTFIKAFILPI